jgi:hypothetical protein
MKWVLGCLLAYLLGLFIGWALDELRQVIKDAWRTSTFVGAGFAKFHRLVTDSILITVGALIVDDPGEGWRDPTHIVCLVVGMLSGTWGRLGWVEKGDE